MFLRASRRLVAAVTVPLAFGARALCEDEKKSKFVAPQISNLSKYKDLIVLPGSANPKLAEDVANHLGVSLGRMETARYCDVLFYFLFINSRTMLW